MDYKPEYINLKNLYSKVPRYINSDAISIDTPGIVEAFLIKDLPGYFISYDDITNMAMRIKINTAKIPELEKINKKFGGIPISEEALENIQPLVPELLPSEAPVQIDPNTIFEDIVVYEGRFEAILLLKKLVKKDKDLQENNSFWIFEKWHKSYQGFCNIIDEILTALKSGALVAMYYDTESDNMRPINTGFWHAKQKEILWKQSKVLIKEKYVECFISTKNCDDFLKLFTSNFAKKNDISEFEDAQYKEFLKEVENKTDIKDKIMGLLFYEDNEIIREKVNQQNIDNIKDSFSFRVFKLALICDSLGYRKVTNETLADFIYHTQNWYFEGTHKTMTLAKKAASMVRAIDAAKGGVALDIRKYSHESKEIV
jgi:hypothetical protein